MTAKITFKNYLKQYGEHLVQRVTIVKPSDFPRGTALGDALKAFKSEQEKICWCWWPRAQVGAYVTYPKGDDTPTEGKLRALFVTLFTDQYSEDWNK